jgi:hypothetical protein
MYILPLRWRRVILATVVWLTCTCFLTASDETTLNKEQIKQFLLTAKVVKSEHTKKGITDPWRLTLMDGTVTHDASFQSINEHQFKKELARGTELNFVDSYKYNIAAYQLAELLGIEDRLPVYVERKWQGNAGSLSWWLPVKMDEVERHKQCLQEFRVRCHPQLLDLRLRSPHKHPQLVQFLPERLPCQLLSILHWPVLILFASRRRVLREDAFLSHLAVVQRVMLNQQIQCG